MNVWGEVINNLLWSLLGLVLGYFLASVRYTRNEGMTMSAPGESPAKKKTWLGQNVLGVVVIVMAILTVSMLSIEGIRTRNQAQCQAKYNTAFTETLTKRNSFNVQTDEIRRQREDIDQQRDALLDVALNRALKGENNVIPPLAAQRAELNRQEDVLIAQAKKLEAEKAKYKYPKIPDCK